MIEGSAAPWPADTANHSFHKLKHSRYFGADYRTEPQPRENSMRKAVVTRFIREIGRRFDGFGDMDRWVALPHIALGHLLDRDSIRLETCIP